MSVVRKFARPYARAIIDAAGSPQRANEIRGELMRFEAAMNNSAELREFYANPGIEESAKLNVTTQLAVRMKLSDGAKRVLDVLVRFHRINDISAIMAALTHYVNAALGVAVAEVRSAKSLSPDELQQLAEALSNKTGKRVELDVKTDPKLLGGFVARIGSEIWDASVAGKINKFRESLT
jgi:F-type H+-transporting ATPase subunit delta